MTYTEIVWYFFIDEHGDWRLSCLRRLRVSGKKSRDMLTITQRQRDSQCLNSDCGKKPRPTTTSENMTKKSLSFVCTVISLFGAYQNQNWVHCQAGYREYKEFPLVFWCIGNIYYIYMFFNDSFVQGCAKSLCLHNLLHYRPPQSLHI